MVDCGIYAIRCLENNKLYIGSSVNIQRRINTHRAKLNKKIHSNPHLQSAYNTYGKDKFVFFVVETCSKECLIKNEIWWMDMYNTLDTNYGYNITKADDAPMSGRKHTEEAKRKIKESSTGRKHTEEAKKKDERYKGRTRESCFCRQKR